MLKQETHNITTWPPNTSNLQYQSRIKTGITSVLLDSQTDIHDHLELRVFIYKYVT
jgi:hypothetical protein